MACCVLLMFPAGDNDMDTPLHRCETVEIAKILLDHGADVNARNAEGRTVSLPRSELVCEWRTVCKMMTVMNPCALIWSTL